ncbi:MAG: hypothetical protein JSV23_10720 [Promethearchaeota archaeon]|nr:MAG: hypothetical protein JSV23_10720 [Candidatus Lokiarchaeota archaeon]
MELKCSDCSYEEIIPDSSPCPGECPQCGSKNINAYVGDRMKLLCKDCKHEQIVSHRNFEDCPHCGSSNIKIRLTSDYGIIGMLKLHPMIVGPCIVCSLICGIIATVLVFPYFNLGLWFLIPIAFGVGFFIPIIEEFFFNL